MSVNIYTDGACSGNPGIGGWGVVILLDNSKNLKQALEICFLERNKGNISYVETKFNNQENLNHWAKENKINELIILNGEEIDRRKI